MKFYFHTSRPQADSTHTWPGIRFKGNFCYSVVCFYFCTTMNPLEPSSRLQVQFKNYFSPLAAITFSQSVIIIISAGFRIL